MTMLGESSLSRHVHACALAVALMCMTTLLSESSTLAFAAERSDSAVSAAVITSSELIEHPQRWDGQTVAIEGEVIGSVMARGGIAWLHVNDDAYANRPLESSKDLAGYNSGMPIVVPADLARSITSVGDHSTRGDRIKVIGTYQSASVDHGGEMVLLGTAIEILERGSPIDHAIPSRKILIAAVLTIVTGSLAFSVQKQRKR